MRLVMVLATLAACSSTPSDAVDADAAFRSDDLIGLVTGPHGLEWTCIDGCGGLLFPPASYDTLDVVARDSFGYAATWRTDGTSNEASSDGVDVGETDCVVLTSLDYSDGSTDPIQFCPAVGGAEATVVYTAEFGPMPERTYSVKARPL